MADQSFDDALDGLEDRLIAATTIALARGMEHVRGVAAPLTPIQSGHLVGSASVTVKGLVAELTYPGPYARNQHYSLDFKHEHGQALYLEQPMITEAEKVIKIMSDTLSEEF